jgi:tRNA threonylcarbamoyladenosine biosynthesis protein TsaE
MKKTAIKYSLSEIKKAVNEFISFTKGYHFFKLFGEMGAGKTTFINAYCQTIHITSEASSPTYSIINEYETDTGKKIYHADLFRLKNTDELLNIGFEDYLKEEDCIIFIEWPQVAEALLPEKTVSLYFETISPTERILTILLP